MRSLEQQVSSIGLSINATKTNALTNSNMTQQPIVIKHYRLEFFNKFTFLGTSSVSNEVQKKTSNTIGKRSAFAPLAALEILCILPKEQTQNLSEQFLSMRFQLPQHLLKEDTESVLGRDHLQHQTPPSNKTTIHLLYPDKKKVDMAW